MQILIKSHLVTLMDSLGQQRMAAGPVRDTQIKQTCSSPEELALAVSAYYSAMYPERTAERKEARRRYDEYYSEHCHVRVAKQDNRTMGGFCVLGGELLCLHSYSKGHGTWLLDHAIELGATKLQCFDVPHLVELYTGRGFAATGRLDNWNQSGPDVLNMQLKVN